MTPPFNIAKKEVITLRKVKIIDCTPINPSWRWYEEKIGQVFTVTCEGDDIIQIWDGKLDRLVLKRDVEYADSKGGKTMKCDTCIHGELCIYRAEYEELNKRAKAALPPEGKAPFIAEVNFKHYKEEKPLLRENIAGGITGPNTHFYGYNRDER